MTRVSDVVGAVRHHLVRRAWGAAALWGLVVACVFLLAAWILAGGDGWEQGTAGPLVLDLAFLGGIATLILVVRRGLEGWLSERRVSRSMEEAAGLASGTVLGSLELSREQPRGVSPSLTRRAEVGVMGGLAHPTEKLTGSLGESTSRWWRRARTGLTILVPVIVLVTLVAPDRSARAWKGLGSPVSLLVRPSLPPLSIAPGTVEVPRGSDVEVTVMAPARDSVTLRWQSAGDVPRATAAGVEAGGAVFRIRDVRAPTDYWIETADGVRSETHRLTPIDPLLVGDVRLSLTFPAHTGRPGEEYQGDVPPLTVPAGTRISVEGRASRELTSASLTDSLGDPVTSFEVDGRDFDGRWTPRQGGRFDWTFQDRSGAPAEMVPLPLELAVVPDAPPTVRFNAPARDTVLPVDLRLPLAIEARDDHGVALLELVAYRVTSLGERREPVTQRVFPEGSRALLARPVIDVSSWGLLPGDTVRYWARVVDNHPAGQEARTREWVLRMPGAAELRRMAEERLQEAGETMEEMADRAGRAQQNTRNLERQAAARSQGSKRTPLREGGGQEESMAFEQREDVRRALEEQSAMEESVDSLRRELEGMEESMKNAGLSEKGLQEDLQELQDLMEEMAGSEARDRLEQMAEGLDEMGEEEARRTLERLEAEQNAFREQIEKSLERFKRAAAEQDFRATTSEAEELARQEEALADAFREGDDPERRAEQQDQLQDRATEMEERMERLEQRLQELGEQDAAREVRSAQERSQQAREAMRQAGEQARQQRGSEAGERADEAAQALQDAVQQLQEAQRQMASEQAAAMEQALRQAADDALSLARQQSGIQERMQGADRDEMADARGDVAAVRQGVENMAQNIAGARGTAGDPAGAGSRELSVRMGQAMEALQETMDAMEARPGASSSPRGAAEAAVDALNQVALMAMAGAQQMSQSGQGQGQESQGEAQIQEQLESLAQQQGQLNNQAGQVMPMQLGQQAMQEQLQQLAQGQQSVADGLGEVADQPGSQDQALGDLQALAEEARALSEELAGGRLDPETRERQERLFHRLLDAGRSLENEEFSDERESEAPGTFERGEVLPLGADALGTFLFRLPEGDVLRRLGPAERQLVLDYFDRLNRGGAGAAGAAGGEADEGEGSGDAGGGG